MKYMGTCTLLLIVAFCTSGKGQSSHGSGPSVRTIIEDTNGNIWLASNEGIIRYNARLNDEVGQGKSFTNITGNLSSDRFFSVLEDRKGNFWFGTNGSGVFYYDGKTFQHFTAMDGLFNIRFLLFMKIKPVPFGLVLTEAQAVTMPA